jgi:dUTPase
MAKDSPVMYCEKYLLKPHRANAQAVGLDFFYYGPPLTVPGGHQLMVPLQISAKLGTISENCLRLTTDFSFRIETPSVFAMHGIAMSGPYFDVVETWPVKISPFNTSIQYPPLVNNLFYGSAHVLVTNFSAKRYRIKPESRLGQLVCFDLTCVNMPRDVDRFVNSARQHALQCGPRRTSGISVTMKENCGSYFWNVFLGDKMKLRDFSDGREWTIFAVDLGHYMSEMDPRWLQLDIITYGLRILGGIVDSDYRGTIRAFIVADSNGLNLSEFTISGLRKETVIPRLFLGERRRKVQPLLDCPVSYQIPTGCIEIGPDEPNTERGTRGFGELSKDVYG